MQRLVAGPSRQQTPRRRPAAQIRPWGRQPAVPACMQRARRSDVTGSAVCTSGASGCLLRGVLVAETASKAFARQGGCVQVSLYARPSSALATQCH